LSRLALRKQVAALKHNATGEPRAGGMAASTSSAAGLSGEFELARTQHEMAREQMLWAEQSTRRVQGFKSQRQKLADAVANKRMMVDSFDADDRRDGSDAYDDYKAAKKALRDSLAALDGYSSDDDKAAAPPSVSVNDYQSGILASWGSNRSYHAMQQQETLKRGGLASLSHDASASLSPPAASVIASPVISTTAAVKKPQSSAASVSAAASAKANTTTPAPAATAQIHALAPGRTFIAPRPLAATSSSSSSAASSSSATSSSSSSHSAAATAAAAPVLDDGASGPVQKRARKMTVKAGGVSL
jgi:hypothetical protein